METRIIEDFQITLQKHENQAVYSPGDPLIGILSFRLNQRLALKSVRILIDGSTRAKWSAGGRARKKPNFLGAVDNHFREKKTLLEASSKASEQEISLEAGDHSYPFKFGLPANLPTSFECENARIRYSLVGTIDLPSSAHHVHVTRAFTIVRPFDLNNLPRLKESAEAVDSQSVSSCFGPCSRGLITGELNVKKTGYVPGETIICHASINNRSRREITRSLTVSLVQQVFCHGRRFSSQIKQIDRDVVTSKYPRTIASLSHVDWDDIRLQIPAVCPSTSPQESGVVEVFYALVLRFQSVGMTTLKEVAIPIVIGTKPILLGGTSPDSNGRRPLQQFGKQPSPIADASLFYYQPCVFEPPFSDLLPVEYDEHLKEGNIVSSNSKTFRPVYPYYVGLSSF